MSPSQMSLFLKRWPWKLEGTLFKASIYHKEQARNNANVKCFNCLEIGHRSYQCTNAVKCTACKKEGHKKGDAECTWLETAAQTELMQIEAEGSSASATALEPSELAPVLAEIPVSGNDADVGQVDEPEDNSVSEAEVTPVSEAETSTWSEAGEAESERWHELDGA